MYISIVINIYVKNYDELGPSFIYIFVILYIGFLHAAEDTSFLEESLVRIACENRTWGHACMFRYDVGECWSSEWHMDANHMFCHAVGR